MRPTRAAWFFAAGFVWLVLRGILVYAIPQLGTEYVAQHGGLLLVVPFASVIATLTVPLFFFSFFRYHPFDGRPFLRFATGFALAASLISFAVVLMSFVSAVRGQDNVATFLGRAVPWLSPSIPLVFVASLFLFLAVFASQGDSGTGLRRASVVAAVGTVIPLVLMTLWVLRSFSEDLFSWYPDVSQSLAVRILGLAAAGTLFWFLETFATSYVRPQGGEDRN